MNVYAIKASGNYAGGMAIVAAKSPEDAHKLAAAIDTSFWNIRYDQSDSTKLLPLIFEGTQRVIVHYETGE